MNTGEKRLVVEDEGIPEKKIKTNRYCSVPQCSNRPGNGVSLHVFPKDDRLKKSWTITLKIGKEVTKHMNVCSEHFKKEDFFYFDETTARRRLKPGSVPSCKLPVRQSDRSYTEQQRIAKAKRAARAKLRQAQSVSEIQSGCEDECAHLQSTPEGEEMTAAEQLTAAQALLELSNAVTNKSEGESESVRLYADKACQITESISSAPKKVTLVDMINTDSDLNAFTGINSLKLLDRIVQSATLLQTPEWSNKLQIDLTGRIVLTMVKIKLNVSFTCIAILFGISVSTCTSYFYMTVELLSRVLKTAVIWPAKEDILRNMPICFSKFKRTRVVLDCSEVSVEKPACLKCRLSTYSHYKGTNTMKFLVGVAPDGLITFLSSVYGGRASDKAITLQSSILEIVDAHSDAIMVDKGFLIEHECMFNAIQLIRPPFLGKRTQFPQSEGIMTAEIASARVHVERAIQRMKVFKLLKTNVPWGLIAYLDNILVIVSGLVNLSKPILALDKF